MSVGASPPPPLPADCSGRVLLPPPPLSAPWCLVVVGTVVPGSGLSLWSSHDPHVVWLDLSPCCPAPPPTRLRSRPAGQTSQWRSDREARGRRRWVTGTRGRQTEGTRLSRSFHTSQLQTQQHRHIVTTSESSRLKGLPVWLRVSSCSSQEKTTSWTSRSTRTSTASAPSWSWRRASTPCWRRSSPSTTRRRRSIPSSRSETNKQINSSSDQNKTGGRIYVCFILSFVHRRRWTTWCWRETTSCRRLAEPSCVTTTQPSSASSPSSDTWRWTSRSSTPRCRSPWRRPLVFTASRGRDA